MKCTICNGEFNEGDNFIEHVHHEIADKQYGIRTLSLAKCLAGMMARINELEDTRMHKPRDLQPRYEDQIKSNKSTGLARDKYS